MSLISFRVPGDPQSLKRHRHFNRGKFVQTYDPSKGDKADFLAIAMANRPEAPLDEPLEMLLTFCFSRPRAHYRTGRYAHLLKDSAPVWHTKIPDADNLIKFVCDSLNGVFWRDDSVICSVNAEKLYGEAPYTHVDVRRMGDATL